MPSRRLLSIADVERKPPRDASSLARLLLDVVGREMRDCSLVLATDGRLETSQVTRHLLALPNARQVVYVESAKDLKNLNWIKSSCGGYFFLLGDPTPLLAFGEEDQHSWDYEGKYVIVGLSIDQLNQFTRTNKGKKTEHIVGVVQTGRDGEYSLCMNQLYWGEGVECVNTWLQQRRSLEAAIFPDKISNLRQAALNASCSGIIAYHRRPDGSLFIFGQEVELVLLLARFFNFSISYQWPPPGEMWGEKLANGSWNGQVGMLGRGESDLAISNRYITSHLGRFDFEHYSDAYDADINLVWRQLFILATPSPKYSWFMYSLYSPSCSDWKEFKSCYLVRLDPPLPRWQNLGFPFHVITWLAIVGGLLLTGPVLYLFARASTGSSGHDPLGRHSLVYACLYMVGVHFRESQRLLPRNPSTQVLVSFMWVYAIILTTAYSSNLTAFLTVTRQPDSIETIKELRHSSLNVLGVGPLIGNLMAQSVNPDLKALTARFASMPDFDSITEQVMSRKGVMVQSRVFLEYMREQLTDSRGRTLVRIIKECSFPFSVGIGYPTHSPLVKKFNRVINWVVESGLFRHWKFTTLSMIRKFKMAKDKSRATADPDAPADAIQATGVIPLGIDHLQGIFLVLLFGLLASLLVFLAERFCSRALGFRGD
ncbi:Variant Ionotropic Glutamate Receptor [Penaeus vannamei]|uniref:Variant Ionotropic Glutamate Receptor n=1 Tax=Penaeus vannamei TaxID=6689 RepID=A0A3R7N1T6_PENVA|nr:Variant Ionotropic Glutamate Receptor [Penaeus vannamei]